jgi:hypothetical protein
MSAPRDPRVTLARADLASAALEGLVAAARFAPTRAYRCVAPAAALRRAAGASAEQWAQLLVGEVFDVLDIAHGWAWGQARRDSYVGHVRLADLAEGAPPPTHHVSALRAYAFSAPDIKSAPVGLYSLNALVRIEAEEGRFGRAADSGWFVTSQLSPIGFHHTDPAAAAERFLGAPYQWGGRESLGLDCSGLVQQALYACGLACPRDSDMQATLGQPAPADDLRRGDLVLWRGHVAMMLDAERMIHANALHMGVTIEPVAQAIARIGEPIASRRLFPTQD